MVAESSSSFTLVLAPPLSPPDWSSSVAASCFLPPSLSVALYVARPLSSVSGGPEREGLQHTEHLLLLVLPDVAALRPVLASFWEQKVFSLLRRSDIITAAAPRRKPALPQIKCVHLKLPGATLGLSVEQFNEVL